MTADTFRQYIPIEIIKGKDGSGNDIVKFKGIASTGSEDADGEFLDPMGFNTDYFLKKGTINWNHQSKKSPRASFIGRPTGARVTENGEWEVSGELFSNLPMAREVIELQKGLKKHGLALGMSIEGQAVLRDPQNQKKVLKANITGLAITPTPKNIETTMELVKGLRLDTLINPECEKGCVICSCELEKSLSAYEDSTDEEREKAMDTGAVAPLIKESVDKGLKKTDDHEEDEEKKKGKKNEDMEKSNTLEKVLLSLPHIKAEDALEIHDLLKKGQKEMENIDKNIENGSYFQKALELLNIGGKKDKVEETKKEVVDKDLLTKSFTDMNEEERIQAKEALQKGLEELTALEAPPVEIEKAVTTKTSTTEEVDLEGSELVKSITSKLESLPSGEDLKESFKAIGTLILGSKMANDQIVKSMEEMNERLQNIEDQPLGSRAVTTENFIEKSFLGNQAPTTTSQTYNKKVVVDTLMKAQESNNFANLTLCQEIGLFETTGKMTPLVKAEAVKLGLVKAQ